jgi:polyphenol oxidase
MADRLTAALPGGGVRFTSRAEGNMSLVAGHGHERGRGNQDRVRGELGLRGLARGYQTHGTRVLRATAPTDPLAPQEQLERADGQATATPLLGALVLAADCMPVAIAGAGAVAMVHAGWRGLAAGVLESGVEAVRELGAAGPLVAVIGPCARGCCYEVGPEVHEALGTGVSARAKVDLAAIAQARLAAAGVESVSLLGSCTICDERFFSHRREGERAGRQAGVAWLS